MAAGTASVAGRVDIHRADGARREPRRRKGTKLTRRKCGSIITLHDSFVPSCLRGSPIASPFPDVPKCSAMFLGAPWRTIHTDWNKQTQFFAEALAGPRVEHL